MSLNSKQLKASPDAKAPKKPKDVIVDPMGQWKYPGEITKIPSNNITMAGVPYPVLGIDNLGNQQMMYPGQDYTFPGQTVTEYPQLQQAKTGGWLDELEMKRGGQIKDHTLKSGLKRGKTHKNIQSSINELFLRNQMIYGPSGRNIYSPLPRAQMGLSTSVYTPGPKQFLTPEQREVVARQNGMNQGEIKPYDNSFANNLYQFANRLDNNEQNAIANTFVTGPMKAASALLQPGKHVDEYGPTLGTAFWALSAFDAIPEGKLSKFASKELKDKLLKQRVKEGFENFTDLSKKGTFNKGIWMSPDHPEFLMKDVPFEETINQFYDPKYLRDPEKFTKDYMETFDEIAPDNRYSKVLDVKMPVGLKAKDIDFTELQNKLDGKNYTSLFDDRISLKQSNNFKPLTPAENFKNLQTFNHQVDVVQGMMPELRNFRDIGNFLNENNLTWENMGSNIMYDQSKNKLSAMDLMPKTMMNDRLKSFETNGLNGTLNKLFYKANEMTPEDFTNPLIHGMLTESQANQMMDKYKTTIEKAGIKLARDPYHTKQGIQGFPTEFIKKKDKFNTGGSLPQAQTGIQTQTQQQPKPIYQFSMEKYKSGGQSDKWLDNL